MASQYGNEHGSGSGATHSCLHLQGVARTVSARPHGDVKMRVRRGAVGVVVELVAMLEGVTRRGRPVRRPVVHWVTLVVVVVWLIWDVRETGSRRSEEGRFRIAKVNSSSWSTS